MVLHRQSIKPIPSLTQEIARKAFPKGNIYMTLRDELGTFYDDEDFAELYSSEGQPALHPGRLALICVMQYMANLSDRGAVEAVAARIDWKYALGLELTDSSFDSSVLTLFRSRLLNGSKEKLILNKLLERCQQLQLIKAKGKARTDSTHILAAIRHLNRLEYVGETLRSALNALAMLVPDWLSNVVTKDWFKRYGNKRHTTWLGYKVHLTETCEKNRVHLITNVQTTQAHLSDVDQTELIHQSLADKDLLPKKHLVDAGYVDGTLLVESKQKYEIELIGPVRDNVSWQSKNPDAYDLSRFKINWRNKQATCPPGVKSTKKWTVHKDKWDNTIIGIKFPRAACRECQFRHLCTRSKTEPREITLRPKDEHLAIVKRRKQQETKRWLKQYNQRAGVEGTISQGIRGFDMRQCRYVGLDKVHLQHILTATAMNAIRLFAWYEGVPLAKTRVSSFAKLAPD